MTKVRMTLERHLHGLGLLIELHNVDCSTAGLGRLRQVSTTSAKKIRMLSGTCR